MIRHRSELARSTKSYWRLVLAISEMMELDRSTEMPLELPRFVFYGGYPGIFTFSDVRLGSTELEAAVTPPKVRSIGSLAAIVGWQCALVVQGTPT